MLTLIVKTRNPMKIYIKFYKSKLPLFDVFHGMYEFSFLKNCLCSSRNITIWYFSLSFKFKYLNRTKNIVFQIVFDFYYFLNSYLILLPCFSQRTNNMSQVTAPSVNANNLQALSSVHSSAYVSLFAYYCIGISTV